MLEVFFLTLGHIGTLGPCDGVILRYHAGLSFQISSKIACTTKKGLLPINSLNLDNANVQNDSLDSTVWVCLKIGKTPKPNG